MEIGCHCLRRLGHQLQGSVKVISQDHIPVLCKLLLPNRLLHQDEVKVLRPNMDLMMKCWMKGGPEFLDYVQDVEVSLRNIDQELEDEPDPDMAFDKIENVINEYSLKAFHPKPPSHHLPHNELTTILSNSKWRMRRDNYDLVQQIHPCQCVQNGPTVLCRHQKLINAAEEKLKTLDKRLSSARRQDKNLYFDGLAKELEKASWESDYFTVWKLAYQISGRGFAKKKRRFDNA